MEDVEGKAPPACFIQRKAPADRSAGAVMFGCKADQKVGKPAGAAVPWKLPVPVVPLCVTAVVLLPV